MEQMKLGMRENHSILIFQTLLNRLLLKLSTVLQVNDNLTVSHYLRCNNLHYVLWQHTVFINLIQRLGNDTFFQKEQWRLVIKGHLRGPWWNDLQHIIQNWHWSDKINTAILCHQQNCLDHYWHQFSLNVRIRWSIQQKNMSKLDI